MTADEDSNQELFSEIADALEDDDADLTSIISAALSGSRVKTARETFVFLKRLVTEETPSDEEEIMGMSKDEVVMTIYRMNFFEKIRHPVLDDQQIEHLYRRIVELWGEAPTEPVGRWAEWNIWVTRHRRRNGISITEVIEGEKTVEDIQQLWVERHQAREKRRKLHKMVNYDRYEVPEDVPPGLRHILFSPFVKDEETVPNVGGADFEQSKADGEVETDKN
jgi:hypothetical protein